MNPQNPSVAEQKKSLIATALEYFSLGFHLVPLGASKAPAVKKGYKDRPLEEITVEALAAVREDRSTGIGIVCNSASLHEHEGENHILVALELEGKATGDEDFLAEWADAAERVGATEILISLEQGWKERTPSGGARWFFRIQVPDAEYATWVLSNVRVKAARRAGCTYAELLTTQHYVIIAPSFGQTHKDGLPWVVEAGGPSTLPTLTVTSLHTLSALLTEVGDTDQSVTSTAAVLDGRTREIMTTYNRTASDASTVEALVAAGWRVTDSSEDVGVALDRADNTGHGVVGVGGPSREKGGLFTFSTSAEPLEDGRYYSPFEAVATLTFGGNLPAFAEHLVHTGAVRLTPWPLMSRKRPQVFPETTPTDRLAARISGALANAVYPTNKNVPFVLAETDDQGAPLGVLSMTRDGGLRRWQPREFDSLISAVVQPCKARKDGVEFLHSLPRGVVDHVFSGGVAPAALHAVRYVASSPVLLPSGRTVSTPGFHPSDAAFVMIARRDASYWKAYSVPEKPSVADAQRALDYIRAEVMADFPWETIGAAARYAACLLTAASRDLYRTAPAFGFDASDRGTGKTKAAALARYIGLGSFAAQSVTYDSRHDEEFKKELVSATLAGLRALHIDELPRGEKISSRVLSELITSDGHMTQRVLGSSTSITIPAMLITACGNNMELGADSNRRFVPIRMVHRGGTLAFERSGFRHADLTGWVMQNRPRLLAALHTILAHGIQNPVGSSALPSGFGSFERWVEVVLGSMSHLTIDSENAADLVVAGRREFLDSQDEEGDEWAEFMVAWQKHFGEGQWVKAKDAHDRLSKVSPSIELPADLLPQIGQAAAGAARSWGRALLRRRDTAVRVDEIIYRLAVRTDAKRGNAFLLEVDGDRTGTPAPVTEAVTPTKRKPVRVAPSDDDVLEVA